MLKGAVGDQAAPMYLQVYIDDFTGVVPANPLQTPQGLEVEVIVAVHTRAGGGKPAAAGTKVYVHAQLAVAGLAAVGLHAAPAKVVVGDPGTALAGRAREGSAALPGGQARAHAGGNAGIGGRGAGGGVDCKITRLVTRHVTSNLLVTSRYKAYTL
eukprot:1498898-Pleurochrysis_carterae.AAC.3